MKIEFNSEILFWTFLEHNHVYIGYGPYSIALYLAPLPLYYMLATYIGQQLMLVTKLNVLLPEGHEHRRFFVSSSSDRDISWVFEIRYDGIN